MLRVGILFVLSLVLPISGCIAGGDTIVVSRVFYNPFYSSQFFSYAARHGVLPVEIYGNPFGAKTLTPETANRIAGTLFTPGWLPRTRFSINPDKPSGENFRLILVFNPQHPAPGGGAACQGANTLPLKPGGGPIRLQAAFCAGDEWLTEAFANGPAASGAADENFQRLINHLMLSLLPYHNPEHEDREDKLGTPWLAVQNNEPTGKVV